MPKLLVLLLRRFRGHGIRALICLSVGCVILWASDHPRFDLRFSLRGRQAPSEKILLIEMPRQAWNEQLWQDLLEKILRAHPEKVGIVEYFGAEAGETTAASANSIFRHTKIVWAADVDSRGRTLFPYWSTRRNSNTGLVEFHTDADGLVRELNFNAFQFPHMAQRLTSGRELPNNMTINFIGPKNSIRSLNYTNILNSTFDLTQLEGKIVIIGPLDGKANEVLTPVGPISRAELLGTVVDNLQGQKWIRVWSPASYLFLLILIFFLTIWVQFYFPRTFALIVLAWILTTWAATSAWVFDNYYLWTPLLAPSVQMVVTYLIFLGYQLTVAERKNWLLEHEQENLKALEQLKNNFVSLFSHDLKTPIAKIQGIVDRMLVKGQDEPWLQDLRSLRQASDELHRYIQSILRVVRVEARDFQVKTEATDINTVIEQAVRQIKPLAQEKKITIDLQLEPLFAIEVDAVLIEEVLMNLIDNAIKYTPNGGRILVRSYETQTCVQVEVQDTGIGIEAKEQQRIWDKFFRVADSSQSTKGSGLGLYLVKYFIELHGGSVNLESQPGVGTKIGFSLPL